MVVGGGEAYVDAVAEMVVVAVETAFNGHSSFQRPL